MIFAVVKNNLVTNTIEYDGNSQIEVDGELINSNGLPIWIGGTYDGTSFYPPQIQNTESGLSE